MRVATRKEFSDGLIEAGKITTQHPQQGCIEYYQRQRLVGLIVQNGQGQTRRYLADTEMNFGAGTG